MTRFGREHDVCEFEALISDGSHYTTHFHCAWLVSSDDHVEARLCGFVSYSDRAFAQVTFTRTKIVHRMH